MESLVVMQIAVAAAQDVLFAIAVGALACGVMLGRDAQAVQAYAAALGRLRLGALCMLALACCLYLWSQAAVMSGAPLTEAGQAVTAVLTQSHFGIAWIAGFVGVMLAMMGGTRASPAAWLLAAAGAIVYTAGKAAASHAADAGDFTLREAVHVVHLCATALWAGSVIVSAFVLGRWNAAFADTVTRRVTFCTQLSHLATIALGVVILTGIYNVTQDTAHLAAPLLSVFYGRLLTLKLALVAVAVLLGGINRMGCLPRLQAGTIDGSATLHRMQRAFDRLLAIEAIAMLAVLIVAAVLGHTSPSGD
jgi:putative copper resistance protein D